MLPTTRGWALVWMGALLVTACGDDEVVVNDPLCPNEVVTEGGACDPPGLVCNYAEPTSCARYFAATCTADGVWDFDRACGGGMGGDGGMTTTTTTGGMGGMGGEPGCIDPKPGPPTLVSELSYVYPPDRGAGTLLLTFDEAVGNVGPEFVWTGAGELESVVKVGDNYRVRYSGLAPGDSAVLQVAGVTDTCENALDAVNLSIELHPSCHLFGEDFEADFLSTGWTTADLATDGLVWASNDDFDSPTGVPNHTEGSGASASANDIDSLGSTSWDAELVSPPIDLTAAGDDVVLRFQSAFQDAAGAGEAWVEVSDDGSTWNTLYMTTDDHTGESLLDLSSYTGSVINLRWRYINDGGLGSWWDVDDVCVEQFTLASCACPGGSLTEMLDVDGVSDGNGTLLSSELTNELFTQVGDRVSLCGNLEDLATSGTDVFKFVVSAGAGQLNARVTYCVENAFQPASSSMRLKSEPIPLAEIEDVRNQGFYDVPLTAGLEHFVSLVPPPGDYTTSRYRLSVDVISEAMPLFTEGFEVWPPISFTVTDEDLCADWQQASQTVVPMGTLPTEGSSLAYFNSYDCPMGSEALESAAMSFAGLTGVVLSLDMFHDPGFSGALDTIQVEYNVGANWIPIGSPLVRPGPIAEWETHMIDLTSLAGASNVRIRLFATSAYGNHTHIDNVRILSN